MGTETIAAARTAEVMAGHGDVVSARLPMPEESDKLGMPRWAGVPVIVITRADGTEELFDSRQVQVIIKAVVTARMSTRAERAALDLPEGVSIISLQCHDGAEELLNTERAEVALMTPARPGNAWYR